MSWKENSVSPLNARSGACAKGEHTTSTSVAFQYSGPGLFAFESCTRILKPEKYYRMSTSYLLISMYSGIQPVKALFESEKRQLFEKV